MANPGAFPLDPSSPVGELRLVLGDTQSVPLDPPVTGQQDYTMFSDAELNQFISMGSGTTGGAAYAYLQLAASAAMEAKNIATDDLRVSTEKRADALRELAKLWFTRADAEAAAEDEHFDIVPTGPSCERYEYFPVRS